MSKRKFTPKKQKELKRIRQFIKRAEKRGYKFDAGFVSDLEGKTTRALQQLNARKLYEQAIYITNSGEYTGLQGRYIEREQAAQKARLTRRKKQAGGTIPDVNDIVYQNVVRMIYDYPSSDGSKYLQNLLNSEIRKYGYDPVCNAMAAAPEEIIKLAQEIIYYELTSEQIHAALVEFSNLIRSGVIITKEESKEQNDVSESIGNES